MEMTMMPSKERKKIMPIFTGHAPAIHCEGCANSIKRSLGKLPGVQEVEVDISGKNVRVNFDATQTSEDAIRTRLEAAGFPVGSNVEE
jgi:copper chaperone CopZ